MKELNYEEQKIIDIVEGDMKNPTYNKVEVYGRIRRVLTEKEIIDQGNKQIESLNKMLKSIEEVLSK